MPSAPAAPPGWYDDPDYDDTERYWSGTDWSADRRAIAPTAEDDDDLDEDLDEAAYVDDGPSGDTVTLIGFGLIVLAIGSLVACSFARLGFWLAVVTFIAGLSARRALGTAGVVCGAVVLAVGGVLAFTHPA